MMRVPRSTLNRGLFTCHGGKDYCSTVGYGCGRHTRLAKSMVAVVEKSLINEAYILPVPHNALPLMHHMGHSLHHWRPDRSRGR